MQERIEKFEAASLSGNQKSSDVDNYVPNSKKSPLHAPPQAPAAHRSVKKSNSNPIVPAFQGSITRRRATPFKSTSSVEPESAPKFSIPTIQTTRASTGDQLSPTADDLELYRPRKVGGGSTAPGVTGLGGGRVMDVAKKIDSALQLPRRARSRSGSSGDINRTSDSVSM